MKVNFGTKRSIELLAPRREPYWSQIDGRPGKSIGIRKTDNGVFWLARAAGANGKKYVQVSLNSTNFSDAISEANEALFDPLENGVTFSEITVREMFENYAESVTRSSTHKAILNSLGNLANVKLRDLKKAHIVAWVESDNLQLGHKGKPRSRETIKRMIAPIRASLNMAMHKDLLRDGNWRLGFSTRYMSEVEGEKDQKAEVRRYLTPAERRAIIASARSDAQAWLTLCANIPLRPGDWNDRRVEHFDPVGGTFFVESKKHPRHIKLSPQMVALLKDQCKSKTPKALVFTRQNDGVTMWQKINWNEMLKVAAEKAGIKGSVVLYDFRHSVITDLLEAGLSIMQTAKLAGTSALMIEKHYSKVLADRQEAVLERIAI